MTGANEKADGGSPRKGFRSTLGYWRHQVWSQFFFILIYAKQQPLSMKCFFGIYSNLARDRMEDLERDVSKKVTIKIPLFCYCLLVMTIWMGGKDWDRCGGEQGWKRRSPWKYFNKLASLEATLLL